MNSDWKNIPYGWKLTKLQELGEVNRGRSKHRPRYAEYLYGGPYPFIQTGDVKNSNGRITTYSQTYSEEGLKQSKLWPKQTLCITIAANIAETGILTFPACFPDSIVGFVANNNKCDEYFIEYMFRFLRKGIQRKASGSVQDNINLQILNELTFPIPSIQKQKQISHILKTLDDKIELNRQMCKTLEDIASALFKSWFIDFDPVKAKAEARELKGLSPEIAALFPDSLTDSSLGQIPNNWKVGEMSNLAEINSGKRPASREANKSLANIPIYGSGGVMGYTDNFLHSKNILLTGRVGTLGLIFRITNPCWPSDNTLVLLTENHVFNFLYFTLKTFDLKALNKGSTQPLLTQSDLNKLKITIPTTDLLEQFQKITTSIFDKIASIENNIENLTCIRDILLPKLISGELQIKNLGEG